MAGTTRAATRPGVHSIAREQAEQVGSAPLPRLDNEGAVVGARGSGCRECGQPIGAAGVDYVTRLPDRWGWDLASAELAGRAAEAGAALVLVMLDIDNFKGINDTYGHLAGDVVLGAVANALRAAVGSQDAVARYGGDEFLALCEVADAHEAIRVAHRLAEVVGELSVVVRDPAEDGAVRISVTVAAGAVAVRPNREERVISLVKSAVRHADAALLEAKGADDRVCLVFIGPTAGGEFGIV